MNQQQAQTLASDLRSQGKTYDEIVSELRKRKFKTRLGTPVTKAGVSKWLSMARKLEVKSDLDRVVIVPKGSSDKVLLIMCSFEQAKELLG